MAQAKLDHRLLEKLVQRTGRKKSVLQSSISQLASRYAIASEAALILLAKKYGIGSAHYLKNLPGEIQSQVRDTLPAVFATPASGRGSNNKSHARAAIVTKRQKNAVGLAAEYLIHDSELHARVVGFA